MNRYRVEEEKSNKAESEAGADDKTKQYSQPNKKLSSSVWQYLIGDQVSYGKTVRDPREGGGGDKSNKDESEVGADDRARQYSVNNKRLTTSMWRYLVGDQQFNAKTEGSRENKNASQSVIGGYKGIFLFFVFFFLR